MKANVSSRRRRKSLPARPRKHILRPADSNYAPARWARRGTMPVNRDDNPAGARRRFSNRERITE